MDFIGSVLCAFTLQYAYALCCKAVAEVKGEGRHAFDKFACATLNKLHGRFSFLACMWHLQLAAFKGCS